MELSKIVDPSLLTISAEHVAALRPYLAMFGGALIGILFACFNLTNRRWLMAGLSILTCLVTGYYSALNMGMEKQVLFSGMMVSDGYSHFFNVLFAFIAALTIFSSYRYLDRENLHYPEYYILLLFSALGMMLLTSSLDLIVLFIALEIMSLSVYVLVGFRRADRRSNEASMKYFILGAAASAILLYGSALLYGATGSLNIADIMKMATNSDHGIPMIYTVGSWLVAVGFLFKVASVPFHTWMPDVYEGAPTPITGFMTTGVKAASFATFIRILMGTGFGSEVAGLAGTQVETILWVVAVLTMFIGNVIALTQTQLKRMLAYSSIAHTGYLIVGLLAAPHTDLGYAPVVMYLVTYSIMNLGAFAILTILSGKSDTRLNLSDLSGLSQKHPWLAFALAVFFFSMAGIPPTAGFAAKYYLLYSAVQAKFIWLVVLAVLCSAISVYYYLRVLVQMYMRDPVGSENEGATPAWSAFVVAMTVALTLQVGLLPSKMVDLSKRVVETLKQ